MYNSGQSISSNDVLTQNIHKVIGTVTFAAEAAAGTETLNFINGESSHVGMTAAGTAPGTATLEMKLTDTDSYGLVATGEKASNTTYITGTTVPLRGPIAVTFEISGTAAAGFTVPYVIYYKK